MDSITTTKLEKTGTRRECAHKDYVSHLNLGPLKKRSVECSSCPNTSSNRAENIPTPAPLNPVYFLLLHGFKETELLFKSAFTKKPLKSVKINYFKVFFTNTPPAFPSFPICCSTESNCDYI